MNEYERKKQIINRRVENEKLWMAVWFMLAMIAGLVIKIIVMSVACSMI